VARLEIGVVSAEFAVAERIEPDSMGEIAEAGFRSVITSAPVPSEGLQQMASVAGLRYAEFALRSSGIDAADVERFRRLLTALPKPILSYCGTGELSRELYRLAVRQPDDGVGS
jgi:sulfide:quinone oxidoreductase